MCVVWRYVRNVGCGDVRGEGMKLCGMWRCEGCGDVRDMWRCEGCGDVRDVEM